MPERAGQSVAESHQAHAQQCWCLNDSAECCRPSCACHRGAAHRVNRLRRWLPRQPRIHHHITLGRESGYAACCIAWFCAFAWMPDRAFDDGWFWNLLRVPHGRGFIPCPRHYRRTADA